jgi:hypothetical protein
LPFCTGEGTVAETDQEALGHTGRGVHSQGDTWGPTSFHCTLPESSQTMTEGCPYSIPPPFIPWTIHVWGRIRIRKKGYERGWG